MSIVRRCRDDERAAIVGIVNAAAQVYRDVIPADRWHEPYMQSAELDTELGAGVVFWGYEREGRLVGVMGLQPVRDVDLIRHAYVLPDQQRQGIGVPRCLSVCAPRARDRCWSGPGRPRIGQFASIAITGSNWFLPNASQRCSRPIGAYRSDRSRPPLCWPAPRSAKGMLPAGRKGAVSAVVRFGK